MALAIQVQLPGLVGRLVSVTANQKDRIGCVKVLVEGKNGPPAAQQLLCVVSTVAGLVTAITAETIEDLCGRAGVDSGRCIKMKCKAMSAAEVAQAEDEAAVSAARAPVEAGGVGEHRQEDDNASAAERGGNDCRNSSTSPASTSTYQPSSGHGGVFTPRNPADSTASSPNDRTPRTPVASTASPVDGEQVGGVAGGASGGCGSNSGRDNWDNLNGKHQSPRRTPAPPRVGPCRVQVAPASGISQAPSPSQQRQHQHQQQKRRTTTSSLPAYGIVENVLRYLSTNRPTSTNRFLELLQDLKKVLRHIGCWSDHVRHLVRQLTSPDVARKEQLHAANDINLLLRPLDFDVLQGLLTENADRARDFQGKDITILIGNTGVGKSCAVNFLGGVEFRETEATNGDVVMTPLHPEVRASARMVPAKMQVQM
jgi:hypothetical protein